MEPGKIIAGVIALVILAVMLPVAVTQMTASSGNFTGVGAVLWTLAISFIGLIGLFAVLKMAGIHVGGHK